MSATCTQAVRLRYPEAAGIPYAVGGAIAYGYWGAARGTHDVDLNLFVDASDLDRALTAMETVGLKIDRPKALASVDDRGDAKGERLLALQGPHVEREYVRKWLVDCVGESDERIQKWDALCKALPTG